jgi:hypothetical protein
VPTCRQPVACCSRCWRKCLSSGGRSRHRKKAHPGGQSRSVDGAATSTRPTTSPRRAKFDPGEFDLKQTANTFEIDLRQHMTGQSRDVDQFAFDVDVEGCSEPSLVLFLAKQVRESDLSPAELIVWLTQAIVQLTGARRLSPHVANAEQICPCPQAQDRLTAIPRKVREGVYQRT